MESKRITGLWNQQVWPDVHFQAIVTVWSNFVILEKNHLSEFNFLFFQS